MTGSLVRAVALYLPQFHPIPENDEWWGKGFTEWTNTAKARPLFPGHYQPHVPADLGFYDLRLDESRVQQADMARRHGIEAFCYYHYWFAGRRVLNRPFDEVVASKSPAFPFCLCWANETWSGVWHGAPRQVLIEQTYPGDADHEAHFNTLLPAFRDERYMRVDGRPVFVVYRPLAMPGAEAALQLWRSLARRAGLPGIYFVGTWQEVDGYPAWMNVPPGTDTNPVTLGYDAVVKMPWFAQRPWPSKRTPVRWLRRKLAHRQGQPTIEDFAAFAARHMPVKADAYEAYPTVLHAWDNTPRSGARGVAFTGSTPEVFRTLLQAAVRAVEDKPHDRRLVFLKSWNEWAEGNHLEPDLRHGDAYLRVVSDVLGAAA